MISASGEDVIKVLRLTFDQCRPRGIRILHLNEEDVTDLIGHWILCMKGSVLGCLCVCAFDVFMECVSLFVGYRLSMPGRYLLPGFTILLYFN